MATNTETTGDSSTNPFSGTDSRDMSAIELQVLKGDADQLNAYAEIPGGSILRLVGNETDNGRWVEAVEIGRPGEWKQITEGYGLAPTQKYNELVEDISIHNVGEEIDSDSEVAQ